MTLPLLLLLVVVGVSVVVGAVHLAGGSKSVPLNDETAAKTRLLVDFPEFDIQQIILSTDHTIAVIFNNTGDKAGLVVVMGRHSLTRILDKTLIKSLDRVDNQITMKLADLTLPVVRISCQNNASADDAERRLKQLAGLGANN